MNYKKLLETVIKDDQFRLSLIDSLNNECFENKNIY